MLYSNLRHETSSSVHLCAISISFCLMYLLFRMEMLLRLYPGCFALIRTQDKYELYEYILFLYCWDYRGGRKDVYLLQSVWLAMGGGMDVWQNGCIHLILLYLFLSPLFRAKESRSHVHFLLFG